MVRFMAMEASYQRAKWTKSGLRFPVGIFLRVMLRVGGPFALFLAYKILEEDITKFGIFAAIAIAFIGIAGTLAEPGEIATGPEGITQKRFWGLQTKLIPWNLAAASCVRGSEGIHEILVVGRNGLSITHSQYHVGQERFLIELQRRKVFIQGYPAK